MYRKKSIVTVIVASLVFAVTAAEVQRDDNLLDLVLDRCSYGPGAVRCLKKNVLGYFQEGRAGRAVGADSDSDLDSELLEEAGAYVERQVASSATGRAMENGQGEQQQQQQQQQAQPPTATTTTTARADMEMGMMQDKMLMPLMMMMKMKMKMLMPIMMALVSMKATKALILSKVAIMLVLGFLIKEFLKKSGGIPGLPLHLPGLPGPDPSTTAGPPPPMYGPPQSSGYESSSSWEPAGYSSHSSDNSHSMAYSSYLPSSSSSSSGSSASLTATKYS